jgi:hypothetical protein
MWYLLAIVEAKEDILFLIKNCIKEHSPRFIPRYSDKPYKTALENLDWHLYVNEQIESDIISGDCINRNNSIMEIVKNE